MNVVGGLQSIGARENQEDAFRVVPPVLPGPGADLLLLLADGMGGHVGGEIAAELVLDVFEHHCIAISQAASPRQRMLEALQAANAALRQRVAQEPALAGMGATLISVIKLGERISWLSVGDSLLYLFRQGALHRLNEDHSVHAELLEMVRAGRMTREAADTDPRRHALRSAVAGGEIALIDANATTLQKDDLLILASDGLETLPEAQIAAILSQTAGQGSREIAATLLDEVEAAQHPRQDNTTALVYRYTAATVGTSTTDRLFAHEQSADAPRHARWTWRLAAFGLAVAVLLGVASRVGREGISDTGAASALSEKAEVYAPQTDASATATEATSIEARPQVPLETPDHLEQDESLAPVLPEPFADPPADNTQPQAVAEDATTTQIIAPALPSGQAESASPLHSPRPAPRPAAAPLAPEGG